MGNAFRTEETPGDVALFIDWENIKRSVIETFGRMPDLSAIKKAAMQFGKLAVAKAYANWQDAQHQNDCEILYKQGIDPVFVATRKWRSPDAEEMVICPQCKHRWAPRATREEFIKNSVDVRMAIECVRETLTRDNLRAAVLASGDESMLHVANLVKSLGKQVVIMAVSGSVSLPLTYLADKFILYDDLVAGFTFRGKGREERIQEGLEALGEAVQEIRTGELENTFPALKTLIRRRIRDFEEETLGFPKFEYFVFRAEKEGHVRADVRGWQQEVYLGHETQTLTGKPLFGPQEWGWVIARLKDKGPQFEHALRQEISRDKVLADIPEAQAEDFIHTAVQSGVIVRHREMRHYPRTGSQAPYFDLRLNELNSRVQVYLGLEMKPPTALQTTPPPSVPQVAPAAPTVQKSPAERYRMHLRKANIKAISLSREERVEILRLLHDFLGKPQAERPYREQIDEFAVICAALNSAWSKSRVRSLINLAYRSRCLAFRDSPLTSPALLAEGLSVEELVRQCDMRCVTSLLTQEPSLDLAQTAAVLFDSEERVDELKSLIQDLIRTHQVQEEEGKLVLTGRDPAVTGVEPGDAPVTADNGEA